MKRIRLMGLCLVAVFAFTALAVSSAQAGRIGKCVKAAKVNKKYTGKYTEKYCSTKASEAEITEGKKNKYEWVPNAGVVKFTSEGGVSKLNSAAGAITCKKGKDTGEFIGASENRDTFTFEECTAEPAAGVVVPCQEVGGAKGVIITNVLTSHLRDAGEEVLEISEAGAPELKKVGAGEVWIELTGTEGKAVAEFECTLFKVKVSGDVAGVVPKKYIEAKLKAGKPGKKGPGTGKPTFTEEFLARGKGGAQGLLSELCGEVVKEKTGKECVTVPTDQEGVNEVSINPLEKGLEIDDI